MLGNARLSNSCWHAGCSLIRQVCRTQSEDTIMTHVLRLQTLSIGPDNRDLEEVLMSSASGVCPTQNPDSTPVFEME